MISSLLDDRFYLPQLFVFFFPALYIYKGIAGHYGGGNVLLWFLCQDSDESIFTTLIKNAAGAASHLSSLHTKTERKKNAKLAPSQDRIKCTYQHLMQPALIHIQDLVKSTKKVKKK